MGYLIIGEVFKGVFMDEFKDFFGVVFFFVKDLNFQENCVMWVIKVIQVLQKQGWVFDFDFEEFKSFVVVYVDERLRVGLWEFDVRYFSDL